MYSVILMAAMTTGTAETPSFGFLRHCCGLGCRPINCCGFYPAGCYGCSCYGACYGCYGACHGCSGACYGCSGACYGCSGACYGCSGYGYGGCYGGSCYGTYMYPAYSLPATYAMPTGGTAPYMPTMPAAGGSAPAGGGESAPAPRPSGPGADLTAHVIVDVPADAKVYIDDQPMKSTATRRQFVTPRLERDQAYYYIVRAEIVRDGQTLTDTRRVILRAGETVFASLRDETAFRMTNPGRDLVTVRAQTGLMPLSR